VTTARRGAQAAPSTTVRYSDVAKLLLEHRNEIRGELRVNPDGRLSLAFVPCDSCGRLNVMHSALQPPLE
jgi:hypothetical protein